MAEPDKEPHVCLGCGAVSDSEGKKLRRKCNGPEHEPDRVPVLPINISCLDPVEKTDEGNPVPNIYAKRVRQRIRADAVYLQLQSRLGHGQAAMTVCTEFGHDIKAGFCMRCGARGMREEEG